MGTSQGTGARRRETPDSERCDPYHDRVRLAGVFPLFPAALVQYRLLHRTQAVPIQKRKKKKKASGP